MKNTIEDFEFPIDDLVIKVKERMDTEIDEKDHDKLDILMEYLSKAYVAALGLRDVPNSYKGADKL